MSEQISNASVASQNMLVEQGTQTDISPLLGSFDAESQNVPDADYETKEKNENDASIVHWDGPNDPVLPSIANEYKGIY